MRHLDPATKILLGFGKARSKLLDRGKNRIFANMNLRLGRHALRHARKCKKLWSKCTFARCVSEVTRCFEPLALRVHKRPSISAHILGMVLSNPQLRTARLLPKFFPENDALSGEQLLLPTTAPFIKVTEVDQIIQNADVEDGKYQLCIHNKLDLAEKRSETEHALHVSKQTHFQPMCFTFRKGNL